MEEMKEKLIVSLLEGLYVMYMFIFFKTCYSLEIGRWDSSPFSKEGILYHPIDKCRTPKSQICLFGKYGSVLIFLYLLLREFVSFPKYTNLVVFLIILGLCMMNYNAVLYMLPVIGVEIYTNRNKLKNLFP